MIQDPIEGCEAVFLQYMRIAPKHRTHLMTLQTFNERKGLFEISRSLHSNVAIVIFLVGTEVQKILRRGHENVLVLRPEDSRGTSHLNSLIPDFLLTE